MFIVALLSFYGWLHIVSILCVKEIKVFCSSACVCRLVWYKF